MSLIKVYKTILISVLISALFFGCNNSIELDSKNETQEYTQLYVSIESHARTILPETISLDNLSFKLLGAKTGVAQEVIKVWNNKNEIGASSITLKPGEWNLTLNAYSAGRLVLTCSKQNVFLQGSSNSIRFELDEPSEYLGSVDVTFDFPVGSGYIPSARKIVAKLVKDSTPEVLVDSQVLIPQTYTNDTSKQFVRYQNLNVEGGYYFLRFYIYQLENADYTNFHSTYVRVEPGLESKGRESLSTLEKKHTITLNLNGGVWNTGVQIPAEYSEFESLPVGNATFASDYWTNATLDGWYEMPANGDLSNVPIITSLPSGIPENTTLYAKWTIFCEEEDIQSAFDNFPDGRFDIKLTSFVIYHSSEFNIYEWFYYSLNNLNKYVILDISNLDIPSAYFWKSCYHSEDNNSFSTSLIGLKLMYSSNLMFNTGQFRGSNIKKVYFAGTKEDFYELGVFVIPLTVTGNWGYSTIIGSLLNIPNYTNKSQWQYAFPFDTGVVVYCDDGEIEIDLN